MLRDWKGNRRSGVALHGHASQTLLVYPPIRARDPYKGNKHTVYTPRGVRQSLPLPVGTH